MGEIDGTIPPINLKYVKMGNNAMNSRKISTYIAYNKLQFGFIRKTSAYFTFAGYCIKELILLHCPYFHQM
ncbi:hypothetical protein [Neobacillus niacini]|uniref:hypothetical protein n=1 Tax=Neobacillus niacini TaxID=86668 RepID=UPI003982E557